MEREVQQLGADGIILGGAVVLLKWLDLAGLPGLF